MFPEFELKVAYPLGGEHYCLMWHEEFKGNHVILAKTLSACSETLKAVVREHGENISIEGFWRLNIVAPTENFRSLCEADRFKSECRSFWCYYGYQAEEFRQRRGFLPAGLKDCDYNDKGDSYHYECLCNSSQIAPVDGDFQNGFLKRHSVHRERHGNKYDDRGLYTCQAPPANENLPLFAMQSDFGHHQSGVVMQEISDQVGDYNGYLFFFQNPIDLDRANLQSLIDAEKRRAATERRAAEAIVEEQRRQELVRLDKELLELFGS